MTASGGGTPLVSITANTFSGNRAANDGGGLYLTTTDTNTGNFVKMINNTVSGNSALFDGGGIYADTASFDSLKLVDDTIAQNNAGSGGGVYVEGNVVAVVETIIASNVASSQPAGYDVYRAFADEGNNLIGIVNGSTTLELHRQHLARRLRQRHSIPARQAGQQRRADADHETPGRQPGDPRGNPGRGGYRYPHGRSTRRDAGHPARTSATTIKDRRRNKCRLSLRERTRLSRSERRQSDRY